MGCPPTLVIKVSYAKATPLTDRFVTGPEVTSPSGGLVMRINGWGRTLTVRFPEFDER